MKSLIRLGLLLILLNSCLNPDSGEEKKGKDFSKDEVVLEEVNRISKSKLSMDDICIDRPPKFKDLVLVGFFAHDRGCAGEMMFYKGEKIDENTGYSQILKDNGWKDRTKREVLALEWVRNVSLAWNSPMEEADEEFKSQQQYVFMPPTVITKDGEITVAIWVREPSGMLPESSYFLYTAVFSVEEADIIKTQFTDRFSVSLISSEQ